MTKLDTKAEQQLHLLVSALQATANAIVITGQDGVIQWVNEAFTRLTGYSEVEVIGQNPRVLKSGNEHPAFYRAMWETILAGNIWHGEVINRRKDGSLYTEEMTITPVKDEQERTTHFIAIKQDVTARKRLEAALANRHEELERLVQERTTELQATVGELEAFSYSLSHDLRAPLRTIQTFSNLVLTEARGKLSADEAGLLERVTGAAQRMDRLIDDALTLSRISRVAIRLKPVDLEGLVRQIIQERSELQPPKAEVQVTTPLAGALGHETSLTQCLTNLLSNAVKFVAPGTQPKVRVYTEARGDRVRLWVEDNGIGIPAEAQGKIFAIFQRLHPQDTYEGTGIGLAIVKKAAERMKGSVGVDSEPGKGSRFWLELARG